MKFPQDYPPEFILYCDEAGDPGRKRTTASDWFIVSGLLVRSCHKSDLTEWVKEIREPLPKQSGSTDLHFNKLKPHMRARASGYLGTKPVRCFTILSHKANMQGYRNKRVEERYEWKDYQSDGSHTINPRNQWFHNWLLKVLLERVTAFCAHISIREHGAPRTVEIHIANKGGFSLPSFKAYLDIDHLQRNAQSGILGRYVDPRVLSPSQIFIEPARQVPGLQLADTVCGSFLRAVDLRRFGDCDTTYAENLARVMAAHPEREGMRENRVCDFGVMAWPRPLWKAKLATEQTKIFRQFGYDESWLARPGPNSAGR